MSVNAHIGYYLTPIISLTHVTVKTDMLLNLHMSLHLITHATKFTHVIVLSHVTKFKKGAIQTLN